MHQRRVGEPFEVIFKDENESRDLSGVWEVINKKINKDQATILVGEVSIEQIKDTIFGMANNNESGMDKFRSFFFKKVWSIVGYDVIGAIKDFFSTCTLLK